jgi:hypothetical protein
MPDAAHEAQERFLHRIERRARFLATLRECGLGVYLAAEESTRTRLIDEVVRRTARHSELPHLTPAALAQAAGTIRNHLEAMQTLLPHDVQYRNRMKRNW